MHKLIKSLGGILICLIFTTAVLIGFMRFDKFGNAIILRTTKDSDITLLLDNNTYNDLQNRKQIKLLQDNAYHNITIKNKWTYEKTQNCWTVSFEYEEKYLNEGMLKIYLKNINLISL